MKLVLKDQDFCGKCEVNLDVTDKFYAELYLKNVKINHNFLEKEISNCWEIEDNEFQEGSFINSSDVKTIFSSSKSKSIADKIDRYLDTIKAAIKKYNEELEIEKLKAELEIKKLKAELEKVGFSEE